MARLVYADAFIENMLMVESENKREEILHMTDLLSDFPDLGSKNIPESIRLRYGDSVRKLVVSPFDVVYEHSFAVDTVNVLGLVHQRAAF